MTDETVHTQNKMMVKENDDDNTEVCLPIVIKKNVIENLNDVRIPHDSEYSRNVELSVRRSMFCTIENDMLSTTRRYLLGGTPYTVRSFFELNEKKTPEDMIRRLIDLDCGNVSAR